ncbi:MAG: M23 family metallopeptidase [Actinomycetota bacterium]|nr:M23 family metallopeptidase [Actinomycetota bacterium]
MTPAKRVISREWRDAASGPVSTRALGTRGGKAPFVSRASALTLLIITLLTILFFSFQPPPSPAVAAGEEAPSFDWPARGEITCPFAPAAGPYGAGGHSGIDIALARGSEVRSAAAGTVTFAGGTPVGPCVSVAHGACIKTTYVSLGAILVRRGQRLAAGQVLGTSDGSRDRSSQGPHLHFGLFMNGIAVDPLPFLEGRVLDPSECLFLGPWEDVEALRTFMRRHGAGGYFEWLGRGFSAGGRALGGAFKAVWHAAGKAGGAAWRLACRVAGPLGRAVQAFYRACVEPWLVPFCRGVAEVARAALSNRVVQAVLAALAAAAIVCLAVAGIAVILGLSLAAAVTAAVVGSVAAIGYAVYYTFASGDSFSFLGCFLGSLTIGMASAGTCLTASYLAPFIASGWSQVGLLGFGKTFLSYGCAEATIYVVFCAATGKDIHPFGLLASFFVGGLTGGLGKLVTTGFLSSEAAQALAAGFLSSGGSLVSGEAAAAAAYAGEMAVSLSHRLAYVCMCGCTATLGDAAVRMATGNLPSLAESLLCFGGGALVGAINLAGNGQGLVGVLSRASGGRLALNSEFLKALLGKSLSKGFKEGCSRLLPRLLGRRGEVRESLWNLEVRPPRMGDGMYRR